jgi:NOL1/NOP2/sun family putative RNA methylase
MQHLLREEFPSFLSIYQDPPTVGLRANTLKISSTELAQRLPYTLQPLRWAKAGFQIHETPIYNERPPGRHPYHAAGLYYLQEPSAMIAAELLNPLPGERVLDLCAAPGGKTTHLAALMEDDGLLVANEIHPKRLWELTGNLERWGVHNVVITNETPARLAEWFQSFFDKILVDAPCSGEGMFRKSETARRDWSPTLVTSCAARQSTILHYALKMLRPGGRLVYSTCTFNTLENESVIAQLLEQNPDLDVLEAAPIPGISPGRLDDLSAGEKHLGLEKGLRLWPHLAPGEGHFAVLLHRKGSAAPASVRFRKERDRNLLTAHSYRIFEEFCRKVLKAGVSEEIFHYEQIKMQGSYLYRIPPSFPLVDGLNVLHPGWWLGSFHSSKNQPTGRFIPSHTFALGLRPDQVQRCCNLEIEDPRLTAYLHGEAIDSPFNIDGWSLMAVDGYSLGWGKSVSGILKNFYPKGLRQH